MRLLFSYPSVDSVFRFCCSICPPVCAAATLPSTSFINLNLPKAVPAASFCDAAPASSLDQPVGFWGLQSQCVLPTGRITDEVAAARAAAAAATAEFAGFQADCGHAIRSAWKLSRSMTRASEERVQAGWDAHVGTWHPSRRQDSCIAAWEAGKAADLPIPVIMASGCKTGSLRCLKSDTGVTECVTAVAELRSTACAPAEALPQALVAACSAALHLASLGLPASQCVVPFISSTSVLEQHGLAYLLEPAAPCAVLVSPVMDLLDEHGLQQAIKARWVLKCIAEETERLAARVLRSTLRSAKPAASAAAEPLPLVPAIARGLYFFKKPLVFEGELDADACHRIHLIFRALARSAAAAPLCVLPLATFMRDPEHGLEDGLAHDGDAAKITLVFPNLRRDGFTSGLPSDPALRVEFFQQLRHALVAIHAAGVVHCDLFPHNIMWRAAPAAAAAHAAGPCADMHDAADADTLSASMASLSLAGTATVGGGTGAAGAVGGAGAAPAPPPAPARVELRLIDWDAALFICQPISAEAVKMVDGNGHTTSYHPRLFAAGTRATPQLDWWHYHMLQLGAPFGQVGHSQAALDAWLDTVDASAGVQTRRAHLVQLAAASAAEEQAVIASVAAVAP